jgi:hypothetical protein
VTEYEKDIIQNLLRSRGLVIPNTNREGMVDVYENFIDTLQVNGVISTAIDRDKEDSCSLLDIINITFEKLNKLEGI